MKNKLRLLIREAVSKVFESDFDQEDYNTFDPTDIPELSGDALKAAMADIEAERLEAEREKNKKLIPFKKPSDEEIDNIVSGLKQANLDLPSDDKSMEDAKGYLNLNLKYPKMGKFSLNELDKEI